MVNLNFYKDKKVFITGHTGFKGSWLCETLIAAGAKVKGYSLTANTSPNLFGILNLEKRMDSVIADIRDLTKLKKEIADFKPEIVFHLAAQPLVRESYKTPVDTYSTNVMGTVNLLEACRNVPSIKSIINITTDKVYLNVEKSEGYTEDEYLCGYDPYSNSKSCSELVTYSYKKSFYINPDSPSLSTARSGNVIGGGDFSSDRIIPDCVKAAAANEKIVVRNPHSTRPYQHVLDCLDGYLTLAEAQYSNHEKEGNYNFGPDDESCVTTGTLTDLFCKNWNGTEWVVKSDGGPHEANFLKLNCDKAKAALEWKPRLNISQAMRLTAEWYLEYNKKGDLQKLTKSQITEFFK